MTTFEPEKLSRRFRDDGTVDHRYLPKSDLSEKRFNRLVAKKYISGKDGRKGVWICLCDCGKLKSVLANDLKTGHTKSCGCYSAERRPFCARTHGATANGNVEKEFMIWCSMRARCTDKSNKNYKEYGGRGIKVCERWTSYKNFISDMGRKPSSKHTLERKNNDDGYHMDNCYWATRAQQAHNKRNTKLTVSIAEDIRTRRKSGEGITGVSKSLGLPISTVGSVWYETGWKS